MLRGVLYDANYNPELIDERQECKVKCFKYNWLCPTATEKRRALLKGLLGKTGNFLIEIGENFYSNFNCVILDGAKVKFGDNVFVAPNCGFYTAGHPLEAAVPPLMNA